MKKIWITWERHRRTTELVDAMGDVRLYVLQLEAVRPIRYAWLLSRTLIVLLNERPDIVFIQNPSMVLALFMATIGRWFTRYLVVDSHNEGVLPFHAKHRWLLPLYRLVQRRANVTIVTNEKLGSVVHQNGGQPIVLPDRLPRFGDPGTTQLEGDVNIVFICTFEKDEPYRQVIEAAALMDEGVRIYVTGRYQKAPSELVQNADPKITFTGFLSETDYAALLNSCDAVMDLTLMEDCLVCGAYEAVSLEKPMILSDTEALRGYFSAGAVYTGSTPQVIAQAVRTFSREKDQLRADVQSLKISLGQQWQERANQLHAQIQAMT